MTKSDFQARLAKRFANIKAGPLSEIGEFVEGLAEEDIGKLWENFGRTYINAVAPQCGVFEKLAWDLGIRKAKGQESGEEHEYLCHVCTARFPLSSFKCPSCGNRDHVLMRLISPREHTNREASALIVEQFPPGPHPTLGIKKPVHEPKLAGATNRALGRNKEAVSAQGVKP